MNLKTILLFCIVCLANALPSLGQNISRQIDAAYSKLDEAIANSGTYERQKQDSIKIKLSWWKNSRNVASRFAAAEDLYREYRSYNNDSALVWLYECQKQAKAMKDVELSTMTTVRIAHQFVVSGYYTEALEYFSQVRPELLTKRHRSTYYYYLAHFYRELALRDIDKATQTKYIRLTRAYCDSFENIQKHQTAIYLQRHCITLFAKGDYKEALRANNEWKAKLKDGTISYALMAYYRASIFRELGKSDDYKYWLAVAATAEIQSCDNNVSALWELADLLSEDKDFDRAMKYIDVSWRNISRFSSNKRAQIVAPVINRIHMEYQTEMAAANKRMTWLTVSVCILALFLILALFYVIRGRRRLTEFNERLKVLNAKLYDSNRVKDEYISEFMQICSSYIDKMDKYRLMILRKLKANQLKDLMKVVSSETIKREERSDLMMHFDTVFLHLFPNFINEFNALLKPDARVVPTEPGRLTPVLRIFALIRLGIDESSKIADFIGFQANTVYNYRSRLKQHSIGDKADFEKQVKAIGMTKEV